MQVLIRPRWSRASGGYFWREKVEKKYYAVLTPIDDGRGELCYGVFDYYRTRQEAINRVGELNSEESDPEFQAVFQELEGDFPR